MSLATWKVTDEGVAVVTLADEAHRNALSAPLRQEMSQYFDEFENSDDLRVLIIAAEGAVFCAGGDLKSMPGNATAARRFLADILTWLARPEKMAKPVIAAVEGPALGGGLELAIACDLIIASERAEFGTPEALVGLAPGFAMVRLARLVGPSLTKELAFTGRRLRASEALQLGLVNRVVEPGSALDAAREIARTMVRAAPLSQALVKSAVNRSLGGDELAHAQDGMIHLFMSQDAREGMAAFAEKRSPSFSGS